MKKLLQTSGFDELDRAILEELQVNGRISNADLARKIHLSQSAVHNRIKRLEKKGIVRRYVALLNREALGYGLLCLVHVSLEKHQPEAWQSFRNAVDALPAVLECYRLTGDFDAVMKVVVEDTGELDKLLHKTIATLPGVNRVKADVVIQEVKTTTTLALK
jgi:Lrp/AsnC family transcriptional regulator, leucine-responsive regulatory protein